MKTSEAMDSRSHFGEDPHQIQPQLMKALIKKWHQPKEPQRIRSEDENEGSYTRIPPLRDPSSSTSPTSSNLLYVIPKKRRRCLSNTPTNLSSEFSVPACSSFVQSLHKMKEEEDPGREERKDYKEFFAPQEEPQNLVMQKFLPPEEDSRVKRNIIKEPEEEIRNGICSWCLQAMDHLRTCQFSMSIHDDSMKRCQTFCSERCFTHYRRAAFKKNKYCDLCKKPMTSTVFIQYQSSYGNDLIFCSDSCLKTYKIDETSRIAQMASHVRRPPLSDKQTILPSLHKKATSKNSRRPFERSYSQTPKVRPDKGHKNTEIPSPLKPQLLPSNPYPVLQHQATLQLQNQISMSTSFPHVMSRSGSLRLPFEGGVIPETPSMSHTTYDQTLLAFTALAGALGASDHGFPALPSPLALCPAPFLVPLPIPIPILFPVPERICKGQVRSESYSPRTSQEVNNSMKREVSSPSKDVPIKIECLSDDQKRTPKSNEVVVNPI